MKRFMLILICLLMMAGGVACSDAGYGKTQGDDKNVAMFYGIEDKGAYTNPDMGWIFYDNVLGDHKLRGEAREFWRAQMGESVQDIAVMTTWDEIEKTDDVFDFSELDETIAYWTSYGKRIHIRMISDGSAFAGQAYGVPEWLFEEKGVDYYIQDKLVEGVSVKFPDYNNEVYRAELTEYLHAFAEHYKGNPDIVLVDLRGFGMWGEWHTGYPMDTIEERREILSFILKTYHDAWGEEIPLVLSCSNESPYGTPSFDTNMTLDEFMYYNCYDIAFSYKNMTIRRDGQGGWIQTLDGGMLRRFWESGRRLPIVLEGAVAYSRFQNNQAGLTAENALREIMTYHANYCSVFGHDSLNADPFFQSGKLLLDEGLRSMGYRPYLNYAKYTQACVAGGQIEIMHEWTNEAFGRAYRNYPLKFFLLDKETQEVKYDLGVVQDFDLTQMVNGEIYRYFTSLYLPDEVSDDEYILACALVKENESTEEYVRISNDERNKDGYVLIGNIEVGQRQGQLKRPQINDFDKECRSFSLTSGGEIKSVAMYGKTSDAAVGRDTNGGIFLYTTDSFKRDTRYRITFDYKICETDGEALSENGFFVCAVDKNKFLAKKNIKGETGSCGKVSFTFLTETEDAQLQWGMDSFGEIAIDNIIVEETERTLEIEEDISGAKTENGAIMQGGNLQATATGGEEERVFFSVNIETLALPKDESYVLTLRENCFLNLSYGCYYYIGLINEYGETVKQFRWYDFSHTQLESKEWCFYFSSDTDYKLVIGAKGKCAFSVCDVAILGV